MTTFEYNIDKLPDIIGEIKNNFSLISEEKNEEQRILSKIALKSQNDKISVNFYGTGKCLVQGKKGFGLNKVEEFIESQLKLEPLKKREIHLSSSINETQIYDTKEFIIGFDETGTGETIGPAIFGGVCLPKDKLKLFDFLPKNLKNLTLKEANYYCDLMKKYGIRFEHCMATAYEFTNSQINKNRLMDNKYIELLRKFASSLNKSYILAFDDYNIRDELKLYLDKLATNGIENVCEYKMDEMVTATKLASIVAKQIRLSIMADLARSNQLYKGREIINFGKGANNEQTTNWLIIYREQNPYLDFPDFVKTNWKNVQEIETKYPKINREISVNCPHCSNKITMLLMYYSNKFIVPSFYCCKCNKNMERKEITFYENLHLMCDTSALVVGALSKEIEGENELFRNPVLILPHKIMSEIDTIKFSSKRGANNELERLKSLEDDNKLKIKKVDFEITDPYDADQKLYDSIAKRNNCVLLTADKNLANNVYTNGVFVIKIINYNPEVRINKIN